MEIVLFLGIAFIATFFIGELLERMKIPWIFASLIIGLAFSQFSWAMSVYSSQAFQLLSQFGMYLLLFMIGMEMNLKKIERKGKLIMMASSSIILGEALVMGIFIHFIFHYPVMLSLLISLSFATVGEAILLPILDELGLTTRKIGQLILAIATIDDAFELFTFVVLMFFIGSGNPVVPVLSFLLMILFTIVAMQYHTSRKLWFMPVESIFLLVLSIAFLFIGIGEMTDMPEIAAIFAGAIISHAMPSAKRAIMESEIRSMAYGLFAPIFFLSVGMSVNLGYIVAYPVLLISFIILSAASKLAASFISLSHEFGWKARLFIGTGLLVRFSTSVVLVKILYDAGVINNMLFSIIIATSILFTFIIPPAVSLMGRTWLSRKKNR